ncbi:MAG: FAD-dependent oxidoreductase [Nitrososphaerota archaeon]|nr:FAD-dependent oxidoreductase [Candidatus Bathyarchaeota archaeon]MDW8023203.1 FAD-dependent oxidoreductase [Nitrososphaerota archaeon]
MKKVNETFTFEPPPPIPESDIKKALAYDVVVIGAGTAGLAAAVSAAEEHAEVALIEKRSIYTARGGDNTALNSKLHRRLGIHIDVEEIIKNLMVISSYRADERLIRLWAYTCGSVMDWLIDMCAEVGVKTWLVFPDREDRYTTVIDKWPPSTVPPQWDYRKENPSEYPVCHRFGPAPGCNQASLLKVLENKAKKLGVDVRYRTEAKRIEKTEDGRVNAVIAKTDGNAYVRFTARKGVILATGDYGGNKTLVEHFVPEDSAKLPPLMPAWFRLGTGDGHLMAHWVGAQFEPKPHPVILHHWHALGTDPFLMVDRFGKRFVNEDLNVVYFANQCLKRGGIWVIFDSKWPEHACKLGPGFFRVWRVNEKVLSEFNEKVESGEVIVGDNIDELAQKMRRVTPELNVQDFKNTIFRYNELCRMGKDLDFGKSPEKLFPVEKPPFYANWSDTPRFISTLGGLIVNEKLQPVDGRGKPIQGLYCAGNTVGGRFGLDYPPICPGLSHSMAWTYGYIVGKHSVKS